VLDAELRYIHAGGGTSTSQAEETHSFRICHPKKGSAMVDPVTSAAPAGATPAAVTPAAMTEEQLTEAIESTLAAAHLACQPYFLALAELWLPGVKMARTESSIVSMPVGTHAAVQENWTGVGRAVAAGGQDGEDRKLDRLHAGRHPCGGPRKLDAEVKWLRKLTDGALADEVGGAILFEFATLKRDPRWSTPSPAPPQVALPRPP
jgi:hypothetical protein